MACGDLKCSVAFSYYIAVLFNYFKSLILASVLHIFVLKCSSQKVYELSSVSDGHRSCSYVKDLFFTTSKLVGCKMTYQVIVNSLPSTDRPTVAAII